MSTDNWDTSEFSINEILYMGHEPLVYIVEHTIGDALADPFELIARLEEEFGRPLIHHRRQEPM
jgi:hypothetical protein